MSDTPVAPTTPEPYGVPETIAHWRRQAELCDSDMQSATFLHCADEIEEVLALVEARSTELTQPETAAGRLDDERLALLLDDDDWLRSHREHDGHWRCTGVGDDPNETCQVMRLVPARSTPAEALDPRDVLLEFGQWLADNLSARRGMEEALDDLDDDAADMYAGTVDAFLSSLSPHNREAGE